MCLFPFFPLLQSKGPQQNKWSDMIEKKKERTYAKMIKVSKETLVK